MLKSGHTLWLRQDASIRWIPVFRSLHACAGELRYPTSRLTYQLDYVGGIRLSGA